MRHLSPSQTWALIEAAQARHADCAHAPPLFVDVRMEIEMLYVGHPPGVEHVAWYEYPDFTPRPEDFCADVLRLAGHKDRTVILLCRSGQRSVEAGHALEAHGFTDVINVTHGFEGDRDDALHRSSCNGWRHEGLPWVQM